MKSTNTEVWKEIDGTNGNYQVSSFGRIKSISRLCQHPRAKGGYSILQEKILKNIIKTTGYYVVRLYINKKMLNFSVHRLVAITFLTNSKKWREVNHKNGIKTDNRVENLEWVTPKENINHAFKNGLMSSDHLNKPIKVVGNQCDLSFDSVTIAAKSLGLNRLSIYTSIRRNVSHKGYKFSYYE